MNDIYKIDKTVRQKVGSGRSLIKSYSLNKLTGVEFSWTEKDVTTSLNINIPSNSIILVQIKGSDYFWPTEIINNIKHKSNIALQFVSSSDNNKEAIKALATEIGLTYARIHSEEIKKLLEECEKSAALNDVEKEELWKVVLKIKGETE